MRYLLSEVIVQNGVQYWIILVKCDCGSTMYEQRYYVITTCLCIFYRYYGKVFLMQVFNYESGYRC